MQKTILLVGALFLITFPLSGLEISVSQEVTNLYFSPVKTADNPGFKAEDWFFGTNLNAEGEIAPGFYLEGGWTMDATARKRLYADIKFRGDSVSLGIGPFIGVVNTWEAWTTPGISTFFQLDFPGFSYFRTTIRSSLPPLTAKGDYYLGSETFDFGLYVENGLIGMAVDLNRFSVLEDDMTITTDDQKAIKLLTEVFFKNNPLRFGLGFTIQNLTRSYGSSDTSFSVYSGLLDLGLTMTINNNWEIFFNNRSALVNFGFGDFDLNDSKKSFAPANNSYIFSARVGATYRIE